jgi:hypothetical protein
VALVFAELDRYERWQAIWQRIGKTAPEARAPLIMMESPTVIQVSPDAGPDRWISIAFVGWPTNSWRCDSFQWEIHLGGRRVFRGRQGVETRIPLSEAGTPGARQAGAVACAVGWDWIYKINKGAWPTRDQFWVFNCMETTDVCGFDVVIRDDRGFLYEGPEYVNYEGRRPNHGRRFQDFEIRY